MRKIVWFSRHSITKSQREALIKRFGQVTIIPYPNEFDDAKTVAREFKRLGGDDLLVVAPLSVINALLKEGIKPIYAEMESCSKEEAEVDMGNRFFKFVKFVRITGIDILKEEL